MQRNPERSPGMPQVLSRGLGAALQGLQAIAITPSRLRAVVSRLLAGVNYLVRGRPPVQLPQSAS